MKLMLTSGGITNSSIEAALVALLGKPIDQCRALCIVEWGSAPDDRTLGVVDFSIFPHLNAFPTNTLAHAEQWAADIGVPAYAIDEQTAITVEDGRVEVVSEGEWRKLRS